MHTPTLPTFDDVQASAARQMRAPLQGRRVGVLVSGGNVDLARLCSLPAA